MSDGHAKNDRPVNGSGRLKLELDCRHYLGDRPCAKGCAGGCEHFEPMGYRILLIKLGALGDVIRTEALLPGLKDAYPESHITWVSKISGCRILANNPLIDRLLEYNAETISRLQCERFDLLINLDKEPGSAALAMQVQAPDKRGIGLSSHGTVYPLNEQAHYYFALGLSNDLKFNDNQWTYQKLIYDALGLSYEGQRYTIFPSKADHAYVAELLSRAAVNDGERILGLNTGAGSAFANKTWPPDRFVTLAKNLLSRGDCRIMLLGGPDEVARNDWIAKRLPPGVIHPGCDHSELQFAALIKRCCAILSGDTTGMHVAVALRVPVVALFGPTCPQEIDLFGRGLKLISKIDCAPCYKRHCDFAPNCMDMITVSQTEKALLRYWGTDRAEGSESPSYHTSKVLDDGGSHEHEAQH